MVDESVFYISDLSCSYDRTVENRVLYIREFGIPRGKLTFLLGASGSGKSSLARVISGNGNYPIYSVDDFFTDKESKIYFVRWRI